jgi:TonB family protein
MESRLAAVLVMLFTFATLAASQAFPTRVRVTPDFAQGLILTKIAPVYPALAKQARIQGAVILKVQISKSGDVEKVELFSGHPMLASAAIDAVKQWKYKPYLMNDEPIDFETKVTVNFTLSDAPTADGVVGDAPGGSFPGDAPQSVHPRRARVSSGVMQSFIVKKVPPQYPRDAKEIQGLVVLKVIVDKEGNVANIQLISGPPMLAPPAIDAVKQWKYRPYLLNGEPVEVETQVTVNFTLAG